MSKLEQPTQIRSSRTYDDSLAAGAGLESPADLSIESDLNALRSQLARALDGTGAGNWYDALFDSFGLKQIHDKFLAFRTPVAPGTTSFTLASALGGKLVSAAMLVGTPKVIAVGASSATEGGYIAADEANFTVAGTLGAGLSQALDGEGTLLNKVDIVVASTNDPPETATGETIFGLLQVLTGTADGSAVAGGGSENLQISFVYIASGTDILTATTLPAGTYHFRTSRQRQFYSLSRGALLSGVDALPDAISPSSTLARLPFREFDITSALVAANDPLNVSTGAFTTAGAQSTFASFGTPAMPGTGARFRDDNRIKVWRNGQLQSKGAGAGDNRDVYWISATQIAFESIVRIGEVITLEAPESYPV